MKRINNSQGFGVVEVVLIVAALSIIAFVGWNVYNKRSKNNSVPPEATSSTQNDSDQRADIKFTDTFFDYAQAGKYDEIYSDLVEESAKSKVTAAKLGKTFSKYPDGCWRAFKLGVPTITRAAGEGQEMAFKGEVKSPTDTGSETYKCLLVLKVRKQPDGRFLLYIPE